MLGTVSVQMDGVRGNWTIICIEYQLLTIKSNIVRPALAMSIYSDMTTTSDVNASCPLFVNLSESINQSM